MARSKPFIKRSTATILEVDIGLFNDHILPHPLAESALDLISSIEVQMQLAPEQLSYMFPCSRLVPAVRRDERLMYFGAFTAVQHATRHLDENTLTIVAWEDGILSDEYVEQVAFADVIERLLTWPSVESATRQLSEIFTELPADIIKDFFALERATSREFEQLFSTSHYLMSKGGKKKLQSAAGILGTFDPAAGV